MLRRSCHSDPELCPNPEYVLTVADRKILLIVSHIILLGIREYENKKGINNRQDKLI